MATVNVRVAIEDPATQLLTYTTIELYRDTAPDGAFATLVITGALVAATYSYLLADVAGDANQLYRYRLYNPVGPVASAMSAVIAPGGLTLLRLRAEAARDMDRGFTSTCTANGTITALIDAVLVDTGVDTKFGEGGYLYRPNAAAATDRLRRVIVDGFAIATGTFSINPNRPWTNAPASAEVYHFFTLAPPIDLPGEGYSWNRAIREALDDIWYTDELNLGACPTDGRISLVSHLAYLNENTLRSVYARQLDTAGLVKSEFDCSKGGRYYEFRPNGPGGLSLVLVPPPSTAYNIIVQAHRTYEKLYIDTDVTTGPERLAVKAVALQMWAHLNSQRRGAYGAEVALAQREFNRIYDRYRPRDVVEGV